MACQQAGRLTRAGALGSLVGQPEQAIQRWRRSVAAGGARCCRLRSRFRCCCLGLLLLARRRRLGLLRGIQRRRVRHLSHVTGDGGAAAVGRIPAQLDAGGCRGRQRQRVNREGQAGQRLRGQHRPPLGAALRVDGTAAEGVAVARLQAAHHCAGRGRRGAGQGAARQRRVSVASSTSRMQAPHPASAAPASAPAPPRRRPAPARTRSAVRAQGRQLVGWVQLALALAARAAAAGVAAAQAAHLQAVGGDGGAAWGRVGTHAAG